MHHRFPGVLVLSLLAVPAAAQGSDACATAQAIAGTGTYAFDTTAATTDGVPDAACNFFSQSDIFNDVWFAWTAPASGSYTVRTCALASFDTKIAVLTGACPGTVIACNDDSCALQSSLDVAVTGGNVYLIRLGSYSATASGVGSFEIVPFQPLDTRVNPANGHTYHLLPGGSWTNAEATAVSLGGHLATVDDQAEHDWILAQWHNWQGIDRDLWIGLTDQASEGVWVWADGTPLGYTNWDLNEPNNSGGVEHYAAMRKNNPAAFWNDLADAPTGFHANPFAVVEVGGSTGTPVCFGDGSGTACPCANNSAPGANEGCLSSLAIGGKLEASGTASIASDTLVLLGSQMPSAPCLYFQGTSLLTGGGGNGVAFGDGLRCAGGTVIRLGTKTNVSGQSQYPVPGDPSVSVRGLCAVGNVRYYQTWYRNAATFCTASTFNLTNALQITWGS